MSPLCIGAEVSDESDCLFWLNVYLGLGLPSDL